MSNVIFDIETGAIPDSELSNLFSFDESSVKNFDLLSREFDPADVKIGNIKDPQKIKEKIDTAREKFEIEKSGAKAAIETAREDSWNKFVQRAALSPLTGQVLAVGYYCENWSDKTQIDFQTNIHNEQNIILYALECFDSVLSGGGQIIGHNIINFDLPFLIRRGLKYGIKPPKTLTTQLNQYRSLQIVDTMKEWQCGSRSEPFVKLDDLAAFFNCTRKNGNGAEFGKLFNGTPQEKQQALEYLQNDITMTVEVAAALGL